jgi:hypothetical protein
MNEEEVKDNWGYNRYGAFVRGVELDAPVVIDEYAKLEQEIERMKKVLPPLPDLGEMPY